MPAINFNEIPEAHIPTGKQDTFEFFAEAFLKAIGFKIITRPSRGKDGGMDLIVLEERNGLVGKTDIKWLVSCKHKAHTGRTVTPEDEKNIPTRVSEHNCHGFIGFYSVGISSGLSKKFEELKNSIQVEYFDNEKIESKLIEMAYFERDLLKRFFPKSYECYVTENPKPAMIYAENSAIQCSYCDKDLLVPEVTGILVMRREVVSNGSSKIFNVYCSCRGNCDSILSKISTGNFITSWQCLSDLTNPRLYIREMSRFMFDLAHVVDRKEVYTDEALIKLITYLRILFAYVSRNPTQSEVDRAKDIISYGLY